MIINVKVEFIIKSCVQMLSSPKFGLCLFLRFYLLAQTCSSVLIFGILALKSVILKSVFLSWLDESLIGCVNRVLGGDWLVGYKKDKRTSFSLSGWPQLSSSSCQWQLVRLYHFLPLPEITYYHLRHTRQPSSVTNSEAWSQSLSISTPFFRF